MTAASAAALRGRPRGEGAAREAAAPRELLWMALVAVGLRVALFLLAAAATRTGFADYARSADGFQYLAYARAWWGDTAELDANPVFRRLFPGYPALIAVLHGLGVPVPAAALLPSWIACGLVAILCARYFGDRRIGWGAAVLTPSYVFSGSLICTEALCLLLSLCGLLAARRGRAATAGLAFGIGGLFRPVAVFAMLGAVAVDATAGRWRRAAATTGTAGLVVAACLAALRYRFGDALMTVRWSAQPYGGQIFTWPFHSLVATPLTTPVAAWKVAFVAVHLVAVLLGCALAARSLRDDRSAGRDLALAASVWLWGNTLYVLCIGNVWGFHDFPRFLVPALPPLLWAWRRVLPGDVRAWIALGAISVALSLVPATRRLEEQRPHPAGAATPAPAAGGG